MTQEDIIKNIIREEFPKLVKDNLASFANMVIPQHRHNGVDAFRINSFDINTSNPQGFVFPFTSTNQPSIGGQTGNSVNIGQDFQNNAFFIGYLGNPSLIDLDIAAFRNVFIEGNGTNLGDSIQLAFNNSPNIADFQLTATAITSLIANVSNTSQSSLTPTLQQWLATGNFAIQLPDTTRPAPVAGMIAFDAGQFYYCTVTGVWTPF